MARKHGKLTTRELKVRLQTAVRKKFIKRASPKSYVKPDAFKTEEEKSQSQS